MNVLLTAAGRRTYLVRYFRDALSGKGIVIAANSKSDAPAMSIADQAVKVPPSFHPEYAEAVEAACRRFEISLLSSCHDLDIVALAPLGFRLRSAGVTALLPDPDWALLCLDKFKLGSRLRAAGFDVPWASVSLDETRTALACGEIRFPLLLKARLGYGSLGLRRCENMDQLEWLHRHTSAQLRDSAVDRVLPLPPQERVLIQAVLHGREFCVDIVHDLEGRYAAHFVCEVHAMRAGESDSATTVHRDALGDLPLRFSRLTGHVGIWGLDVIVDSGRAALIDVNPRFAGNYPFQHVAGANVPAALIAWARGVEPDPAWLRPAVGVSGYKDLVPTRRPGHCPP